MVHDSRKQHGHKVPSQTRLPAQWPSAKNNAHPERSAGVKSRRNVFKMNDARSKSPRRTLDCCKLLIGAGTQGSTVVDLVVRTLTGEFHELPSSLSYLTIDAADGKKYLNPNRHIQYGVNGIGTDSAKGREAFLQVYENVLQSLELSVNNLNSSDSALPAMSAPREALGAVIVCGNGGSSGGAQPELITLANQLGLELAIRSYRVVVYFIPADVSLNDPTRSISPKQRKAVMQTTACNLTQLNSDFHVKELREFYPPGSDGFSMQTSERVWSPYIMTGSNGSSRISLVTDFNEMLSEIVLLNEFTRAGISLEDRVKDPEQLGDLCRGRMEPF